MGYDPSKADEEGCSGQLYLQPFIALLEYFLKGCAADESYVINGRTIGDFRLVFPFYKLDVLAGDTLKFYLCGD